MRGTAADSFTWSVLGCRLHPKVDSSALNVEMVRASTVFFFSFILQQLIFYYLDKLMLFLSSGNHPCFSCKSAGREVTRCSVSGCGCYYHKECVRKLPGATSSSGGGFCCPQHSCSTCCLERDVQRANKGRTAPQLLFCVRKGGEKCETSKLFVKERSSISFIDNM